MSSDEDDEYVYEISGREYRMLYLMNKSIGKDKFYNVEENLSGNTEVSINEDMRKDNSINDVERVIMIVDVERREVKENMA